MVCHTYVPPIFGSTGAQPLGDGGMVDPIKTVPDLVAFSY